MTGLGGNDTLLGGAGADTLDGGDDVDTADYSGSASRINVNLASGAGFGGDAHGDTLSNIENLIGTNSGLTDYLTGNADANRLEGLAGDDILTGLGGNDRFVFRDGSGQDRITDFTGGAGAGDVIDLSSNTSLNNFADVQSAATQVGADTVIDLGGGSTLTLESFLSSNLASDDFAF